MSSHPALDAVRARIAAACRTAGREPAGVTLVAVSKTHPAEAILPLLAAGQRVFGENRVQEAQGKWPALRDAHPDVELHLVGQLQSNKADAAVALFDAIHSVDRPSVVAALAKAMGQAGRRPACFVQVNIGDEPQKGGCRIADVPELIAEARAAELPLAGLMAVPPAGVEAAPYFALLAKLARDHGLASLSMGMSDDLEPAVMLGATHVRVGSALFGERPGAARVSLPVRFAAILFDFDGVLIESEAAGNRQIAEWLTGVGRPTTREQAMEEFMGLSGRDFRLALERWIGGPIPPEFHAARAVEDERALREGVGEVAGAVAFVRALPPALPKAIVSSSSTAWIGRHLEHLGLTDAFGDHVYSGREHVARGKPAPDLYLYGAERLGVAIEDCAIVEDSPVGATGAVASGGHVIGLVAGTHCGPGHADRLRAIGVQGVASSFGEVAALIA